MSQSPRSVAKPDATMHPGARRSGNRGADALPPTSGAHGQGGPLRKCPATTVRSATISKLKGLRRQINTAEHAPRASRHKPPGWQRQAAAPRLGNYAACGAGEMGVRYQAALGSDAAMLSMIILTTISLWLCGPM